MIPELFCSLHEGQEIIMVNLSQGCERNSRTLCAECMEDKQLQSLCPIKKLPQKTLEYQTKKQKETEEKSLYEQKKIEQMIKCIITLKEKSDKIYANLIDECQSLIQWIKQQQWEQINYLQNLLEDLTKNKLEHLAEMLGGDREIDFIVDQLPNQYEGLKSVIEESATQIQFNDLIQQLNRKQETRKSIIQYRTPILKPINVYQIENFQVFKINANKSLYIFGSSKNIQIWKQGEQSLNKVQEFEGHFDNVTALEMYKSGDIIISGSKDKSLKLWQYKDQWSCYQTLFEHKGAITQIKLTENEDQVISSSRDKTIKIWQQTKQSKNLGLIQTIAESYEEVWNFALNKNHIAMETIGWHTYVDLFKRTGSSWKRQSSKKSKTRIYSLIFINDEELVCLRLDPSKIVVYQIAEKIIKKQEISLREGQYQKMNLLQFMKKRNRLFLANGDYLYVLLRNESPDFIIEHIIENNFCFGCLDITGNLLLGVTESGSHDKKKRILGIYDIL